MQHGEKYIVLTINHSIYFAMIDRMGLFLLLISIIVFITLYCYLLKCNYHLSYFFYQSVILVQRTMCDTYTAAHNGASDGLMALPSSMLGYSVPFI